MKFLIDTGLSPEIIRKLESTYDESALDLLKIESDNVIDVINYFKEIGIKDIETLLITYIDIFIRDVDDVKAAFNKHNIKEVVEKINNDIFYIENI